MQLESVSDDGELLCVRTLGSITPDAFTRDREPLATMFGADVYERRVLVDLASTEFLNSSGVAWLITSHKRFRDHGGMFVLHSLSEAAQLVIQTLRMDRVLNVVDDEFSARVLARNEST